MSQENVEVVRRLFDAFNRQDPDGVDDLWTVDGEWWPAYIGGGLLEGTVFRGRDGLAEFIELQSETWASVVAEPLETYDLGNRVVVQVHVSAEGRASGIPVDGVTWNVFEFREGRVAAGRVFISKEEALEAAVGGLSLRPPIEITTTVPPQTGTTDTVSPARPESSNKDHPTSGT